MKSSRTCTWTDTGSFRRATSVSTSTAPACWKMESMDLTVAMAVAFVRGEGRENTASQDRFASLASTTTSRPEREGVPGAPYGRNSIPMGCASKSRSITNAPWNRRPRHSRNRDSPCSHHRRAQQTLKQKLGRDFRKDAHSRRLQSAARLPTAPSTPSWRSDSFCRAT